MHIVGSMRIDDGQSIAAAKAPACRAIARPLGTGETGNKETSAAKVSVIAPSRSVRTTRALLLVTA